MYVHARTQEKIKHTNQTEQNNNNEHNWIKQNKNKNKKGKREQKLKNKSKSSDFVTSLHYFPLLPTVYTHMPAQTLTAFGRLGT